MGHYDSSYEAEERELRDSLLKDIKKKLNNYTSDQLKEVKIFLKAILTP